jgi:hypothetical protein
VDGAWRTYDPTPAQELPQDAKHVASMAVLVADALDRLEEAVAYAFAHVTLAQLLGALGLLSSMWVGVRWFRNRAGVTLRERAAGALDRPLPFFATLVVRLERRGLIRERSEPLERFAVRLHQAGVDEAARLVERYAALRYGGVGDLSSLERDVLRFVGGGGSS